MSPTTSRSAPGLEQICWIQSLEHCSHSLHCFYFTNLIEFPSHQIFYQWPST